MLNLQLELDADITLNFSSLPLQLSHTRART